MQQKIDKMYSGNTKAIVAGVHSTNDYIVMNALLSGMRLQVDDEEFIAGVKKAKRNEAVLLGYPIKSIAEAAECVLTGKKYGGSSPIVKDLLTNGFNF